MSKNASLLGKKCIPCEGGVPKLNPEQVSDVLQQVKGWRVDHDRLLKTFQFKNFIQVMGFLNQVAIIAEGEGHHPDFCVHYDKVDFTLWTHAIDGLSENDFILAAKLDNLVN